MNIVITGASKGLGRAIAEKFGSDKQGHGLFLCARNAEQLKAFATELQGRYQRTNVQWFACDLADREQVRSFAAWVAGLQLPVDILVNNAGQFTPGTVYGEPEGTLEQMIHVNLYSAYHLTRALLPSMMDRKKGHIFNMCSVASMQAYANGGAYSISKFALLGFSKNLREEMKTHGIKVTSVIPGAAYTDSWSESGIDPKRLMDAADVAEMIYTASLLSPRAVPEEIILRPQLGDL